MCCHDCRQEVKRLTEQLTQLSDEITTLRDKLGVPEDSHPAWRRREPRLIRLQDGEQIEASADCRCCSQLHIWSAVGDDGLCWLCSAGHRPAREARQRAEAELAALKAACLSIWPKRRPSLRTHRCVLCLWDVMPDDWSSHDVTCPLYQGPAGCPGGAHAWPESAPDGARCWCGQKTLQVRERAGGETRYVH